MPTTSLAHACAERASWITGAESWAQPEPPEIGPTRKQRSGPPVLFHHHRGVRAMSNVIQFLETMGRDAAFSRLSTPEYAESVARLELDHEPIQ